MQVGLRCRLLLPTCVGAMTHDVVEVTIGGEVRHSDRVELSRRSTLTIKPHPFLLLLYHSLRCTHGKGCDVSWEE